MILTAKIIVILFGLFLVYAGFLMLFKPEKARSTLQNAGSTDFINYAEITIRMIPAIGMILYSDFSKYPFIYNTFGWFMLGTSIILYFVPRKMHHGFSLKAADILKPVYFQFISPFAMAFGLAVIYGVL